MSRLRRNRAAALRGHRSRGYVTPASSRFRPGCGFAGAPDRVSTTEARAAAPCAGSAQFSIVLPPGHVWRPAISATPARPAGACAPRRAIRPERLALRAQLRVDLNRHATALHGRSFSADERPYEVRCASPPRGDVRAGGAGRRGGRWRSNTKRAGGLRRCSADLREADRIVSFLIDRAALTPCRGPGG